MITELGGSVFEFTHVLIGDLFRAKNAGVTGSWSLNLEDEVLGGGGECNIPGFRCAKFAKI
jgi:hypothetical protein